MMLLEDLFDKKQLKNKDIRLILDSIFNKDYIIRATAVELIGYFYLRNLYNDLWRVIKNDENYIVKSYAINSMGIIGYKKDIPELEKLLHTNQLMIKSNIYGSIISLSSTDKYLEPLLSLLDNDDSDLVTIIYNLLKDLLERDNCLFLKSRLELKNVLIKTHYKYPLIITKSALNDLLSE